MSNTFGKYFRVTTFGESHGKFMGCVVDGCPSNIPLKDSDIQIFLDKRKPGQNAFTSSRRENDKCEIVSGVFLDHTLGSPICILVQNLDHNPEHYQDIQKIFRPNHADYTYTQKYDLKNIPSGGGRASARETVGRVAGGAVAKAFVHSLLPDVKITTSIERVHQTVRTSEEKKCEENILTPSMQETILSAKNAGDSVGGVILTTIENLPIGLGEPVFDKFDTLLAQAMLSIPAVKYFESGEGLSSTYKYGSENNDLFAVNENGKVFTKTNNSGGIQGGISNGMPITFKIGFKPVSTIFKSQKTVSNDGEEVNFSPLKGRHDPCVLPRALIIVQSMTWLVIADLIKAHLSLGKSLQEDILHT